MPRSRGLRLEGRVEKTHHGLLSVAVFLVNAREPIATSNQRDEAYAFQAHLALECSGGFDGCADESDAQSEELDDLVNDLQYRARRTHAVGHGVSYRVLRPGGAVTRIESEWLPRAEVLPVEPRELPDVAVEMDRLGALASPEEAKTALAPLVSAYRAWIEELAGTRVDSTRQKETLGLLVQGASRAASRIEKGIELLAADPQAFDAFRWVNQAMADCERIARPGKAPRWRLFQLAFILLNLPSTHDEAHPDRELVELIFFPTGGGKTQAYLGLIGFTLLLRRLRGQARPDKGLGVAVLLRYTLRLLTLDQLGRAATLICALELLRQREPRRLGDVRFSIGLWVGRSATANTLEQIAAQVAEYRADPAGRSPSPFPLSHCPWCRTELGRDCLAVLPSQAHPERVLVSCANLDCAFNPGRNRDGLPVLFVDEQLYRELPCFLVATVDKFALLPWRGEAGMLFGRVLSRTGNRFFGPCDSAAALRAAEVKLPQALRPPELIVQDELHLISGPLGTMVGLYEAAVLTLAPRAKVVASTATVRRSQQQVERLYGRRVALFPPPGAEPSETFFATVARAGARQYVGVAAPGRATKAALLRIYVSVLAAAALAKERFGDQADPYLTLVGYFNSLRELGGMRRLVEDEVRRLVMKREEAVPEGLGGPHPWARARTIAGEPVELTSREKTSAIREAKRRLELPHDQPGSVDVLLASNMISVGVDIDRLGLMVVAGQPKTTSEYIQATSRVGRLASKPGLVVTCFNPSRPRDRSHYERFAEDHASFYRRVEATSVTPFSAPALDRGLAGVVVALGRFLDAAMTGPLDWTKIDQHAAALKVLTAGLAQRAGGGISDRAEAERATKVVRQRIDSLIDSWRAVAEQTRRDGGQRAYSPFDPAGRQLRSLLRNALDDRAGTDDERKFEAPLSMRDVEASVHLWIQRRPLGGFASPRAAAPEATPAQEVTSAEPESQA